MKSLILVAALLLNHSAALADLVCASSSVHYVELHKSYGIPPEPGWPLGSTTLSFQGQSLGKLEHFVSQPSIGTLKHKIQFSAKKVIAEKHSGSTGWTIFSADFIADDGSGQNPITASVICKESYAAVP